MLGNHFLEVSLVRRAHLLVAHRPYVVPFPATGVLAHCAAGHGTVNQPGSLVESRGSLPCLATISSRYLWCAVRISSSLIALTKCHSRLPGSLRIAPPATGRSTGQGLWLSPVPASVDVSGASGVGIGAIAG